MSATISDKVMMKEVLKATGFDCPQGMENKTFEEATSGSGSSGGGGEDKLLCYYKHVANSDGRPIFVNVIYTDKPATKIFAGEQGGVEQSLYPVDDGKHLFITKEDLSGYQGEQQFVNLIYEDGSPSADLKSKFVNAAS